MTNSETTDRDETTTRQLTSSVSLFANVPQGDEAVLGTRGERGGLDERHVEGHVAVRAGVTGCDAHGL